MRTASKPEVVQDVPTIRHPVYIAGESATGCTLGTAKSPIKCYPGVIKKAEDDGKKEVKDG